MATAIKQITDGKNNNLILKTFSLFKTTMQ